jgi:hypothetical protein
MNNNLPPRDVNTHPSEVAIEPSIFVLVKLEKRNGYPEWSIGRYFYSINDWSVTGMSSPRVVGWALFPEEVNVYCEEETI